MGMGGVGKASNSAFDTDSALVITQNSKNWKMSQFFQIFMIFAVLAAIQVQGLVKNSKIQKSPIFSRFLFPSFTSGYNYDCDYGYGGYGYNNGYYGGYNNGYGYNGYYGK